MLVEDVVDLFIEKYLQEVIIFDIEDGENVYVGNAKNIPLEYLDMEIQSIDSIEDDTLTFNISTEI